MIIYKVDYCDECVGVFFQAAFSTREKAEEYIAKKITASPHEAKDMDIEEYELDSE